MLLAPCSSCERGAHQQFLWRRCRKRDSCGKGSWRGLAPGGRRPATQQGR